MDVPEEFRNLVGAGFYPGSNTELGDPTLEEWIDSVLQRFRNPAHRRAVKAFLDELLSGKYDDTMIQRVWDSLNPSYNFMPPRGTRIFLEMIRDRI